MLHLDSAAAVGRRARMAEKATQTGFARWLDKAEMTVEEAAEALGMQRQRLHELIAGKSYRAGRPATPDLLTRFSMAALLAEIEIPASLKKLSSNPRDRRLLLAIAAAMKGVKPWPDSPG